jgi:glutamine synthetase
VIDRESIRRRFEDNHIRRVKLGAFDMDATLRGKYISLEKFWPAAESGLGFCDVIFGWDIGDVLYDNVKFTGWHTGYPDAHCRIDFASYRLVPWEPGTAFFLLDFCDAGGQPLGIAPRQVFQRVLERAAERGYTAQFSAEYEFFIFRETAQSLRDKHFAGLTPLTPGMFGYSVLRASANAELVLEIMEALAAFDVPLEAFHTETGPGVYEAAIAVEPGLAAADRAALFKTAVKEIAGRHNLTPTFMAKWNAALPGSSGHLHQSLSQAGSHENLFSAEAADGGMSGGMRQYIAGLVTNLPELAAIFCPTVNSYKRTVPGAWAPVNATWGVDNRTTAVRAIPGSGKSTRVELRLTGADINPYLAMAASLAAGLDGIERKLELPPPTVNAYAGDAPPLPRTLDEATRLFRQSRVAREWLGEEFVEHYASTREWEVRQYEKAVTDWELARYFESV